MLVGDQLFDWGKFDMEDDWENRIDENTPGIILRDKTTGETVPAGEGVITDLDMLSDLTGLRELMLVGQPLESLAGIQNFTELDNLVIKACSGITDVSPVFACQQIRSLNLDDLPIDSIQGLQNLTELERLSLNRTQINDFSPLSSISVLDGLDINDYDASLYIPYLENTEIHYYAAAGAFTDRTPGDANALFAGFIASHPQLTELWIPGNTGITDLTLVLSLENLQFVRVSADMDAALASLEGTEYAFEMETT